MKTCLLKIQTIFVYSVQAISVSLFVLYLGFMTHYYVLFYDGTFEMYEYYKQLQVLNKEGFSLVVKFVLLALMLLMFGLHKIRPGLFGLAAVFGAAVFGTINSFLLISVIPKYKRGYLELDFSSLEGYRPSTFVFDVGVVLHYLLIGALILLTIVATMTFIQRLKEGNLLIRKFS